MNRIATTKSGAFVKKYSNEDTVGLSFGTIDINSEQGKRRQACLQKLRQEVPDEKDVEQQTEDAIGADM